MVKPYDIISVFQEASLQEGSPVAMRLEGAKKWIDIAKRFHLATSDAFATALGLQQRAITGISHLESQQEWLRKQAGISSLGTDAAQSAISEGVLNRAVELLEQGRTILFTLIGQLRAPVDSLRLVDAHLAERFVRLSTFIDKSLVSRNEETFKGGPSNPLNDPVAR